MTRGLNPRAAICIAALMMLSACGGGGSSTAGGDTTGGTGGTGTTPTNEPIQGIATPSSVSVVTATNTQ